MQFPVYIVVGYFRIRANNLESFKQWTEFIIEKGKLYTTEAV